MLAISKDYYSWQSLYTQAHIPLQSKNFHYFTKMTLAHSHYPTYLEILLARRNPRLIVLICSPPRQLISSQRQQYGNLLRANL